MAVTMTLNTQYSGARHVICRHLNPYSLIYVICYDKTTEAINFRALAQKIQLKNLE